MKIKRKVLAAACVWVALTGCVMAPDVRAQQVTSPQGLISARDCLSCHRVEPFKPGEAQTVGPAFRLVARRYRDDPGAKDRLVRKVLSGGGGVWGGNNMPPQILTDDEAHTIIGWVLKLK